jgi:FkbM family methyltransferase
MGITINQLPVRTFFKNCKSQLLQDFFVLSELNFKRNGFFVEFGANRGIIESNTFMLEKDFDWTGILAEPARVCHSDLFKNRPNCKIETDCVWKESNVTLEFRESNTSSFVSTIEQFKNCELDSRQIDGIVYNVNTISLIDMLNKYQAPKVIDYLSIDTEGSEFEILSNFDWDQYQFKIITCEHNYTPMREKIFEFLRSKGYQRKLKDFSNIDDWYVLEN